MPMWFVAIGLQLRHADCGLRIVTVDYELPITDFAITVNNISLGTRTCNDIIIVSCIIIYVIL